MKLWPISAADALVLRAELAQIQQQRLEEKRGLRAPTHVVERIREHWRRGEEERDAKRRYDVLVVI